MRVIAAGCANCAPQVVPPKTREGDHHFLATYPFPEGHEVAVDGEAAPDVTSAWVGTPGRVIRFQREGAVHICPCTPKYLDNEDGSQNRPTYFAELVEYDSVEVRPIAEAEVV